MMKYIPSCSSARSIFTSCDKFVHRYSKIETEFGCFRHSLTRIGTGLYHAQTTIFRPKFFVKVLTLTLRTSSAYSFLSFTLAH
jgi:hypothetical protein